MSKSNARTQKMMEALEAGLGELDGNATGLAMASWCEADSDAGYMLHRDGRMMPVGEYQYGFGSIQEMKDALAGSNEELAGWAREEIGKIASNMEPADSILEDLAERISCAFLAESDYEVVEGAIENGMKVEQVFDLYTSRPQTRRTTHALEAFVDITLERDLEVAMLQADEDGKPHWAIQTLAQRGQVIKGRSQGTGPDDMAGFVTLEHPQFGRVGVILHKGDFIEPPAPVSASRCAGPR